MTYLTLKWLHVLSSTLLFGTGLGSAFYMYFASRTKDPRVIATVTRYVVIADWLFTTTTIVFQPLSGLWLAHLAHMSLTSRWLGDHPAAAAVATATRAWQQLAGQSYLASRRAQRGASVNSALLDDIIRDNPDKQPELAMMINRINQIRRASRSASES